ncbi:MAG: hypothetical protein DMF55_12005, partial [Acidobacteria bacterium]
ARKLREVEQQLEDLTRFREVLEGMIRDWDVRLAHREGEAPLRLLETLPPNPAVRRSPLQALAFDQRRKRKEPK